MAHRMKRSHYAEMFGPTTGDKVRLGDTALMLEVERDYTAYGDECKFGGGKVLREGAGQAAGVSQADALDCLITNALVVDYTGIYKADIGIKNGLIAGIGKGGNPDVMAGDQTILDPNIGFINPGIVHHQGIGDETIEGIRLTHPGRLTGAFPKDFAATKFALIPIHGVIALDFKHERGVGKTDFVACGRTKH